MKFVFVLSLCFSLNSLAGPTYDQLTQGLPKEVIQIIDRRIGCNYWSGEIPKDANSPEVIESGRPQMIERKSKELKCSNLEKDEAAFKVKYKKKTKVLEAIDEAQTLTPAD